MRQVRTKIINDLLDALHEANLADCTDEGYANDLPPVSASQDNLFGHIAEAIKLLEPELYWQYCEMGYKPTYADKGSKTMIKRGDYVQETTYGYKGRVLEVTYEDDEAWKDIQEIPLSEEQREGLFVRFLVHGGGSAKSPINTVEIIEPFELNNKYSSERFN